MMQHRNQGGAEVSMHHFNTSYEAFRVHEKPRTPEQPGSALFLQLESRTNTIMPLIEKTLQ